MTTTATSTRRTRKTAEPTDPRVQEQTDLTAVVKPGVLPPEPVQEPSEKPVSDANSAGVAQPATDVPTEPEKEPSKGRQPYSREVFFTEAEVSKQYFAAFGIDGGTAIVKSAAPDVEVQANKKAESLTLAGKKRDVDKAAKVLVETWVAGFAAFNIWRRTDAAYLALQHTGKEATVRYHREQDWLSAYAHAAATQQQDAS